MVTEQTISETDLDKLSIGTAEPTAEELKKYKRTIFIRDYTYKNKDKLNLNARNNYKKNKIKILKRKKIWKDKNILRLRSIDKKCKYKHKNKYNISNNIYKKKRYKLDINTNLSVKIRRSIYRNLLTSKNIIYGNINMKKIREHLINTIPTDYSEKKYHIDHIKPLCSFDLTQESEIIQAFKPENHRWLLAEENLKKSAKDKLQSIKLKEGYK